MENAFAEPARLSVSWLAARVLQARSDAGGDCYAEFVRKLLDPATDLPRRGLVFARVMHSEPDREAAAMWARSWLASASKAQRCAPAEAVGFLEVLSASARGSDVDLLISYVESESAAVALAAVDGLTKMDLPPWDDLFRASAGGADADPAPLRRVSAAFASATHYGDLPGALGRVESESRRAVALGFADATSPDAVTRCTAMLIPLAVDPAMTPTVVECLEILALKASPTDTSASAALRTAAEDCLGVLGRSVGSHSSLSMRCRDLGQRHGG